MQRSKYYNREGKLISFDQWGKLYQNPYYKIVKQEYTKVGFFVSTVWLGIDHNFDIGGKPIIFETMVFTPNKTTGDLDCERYSDEFEAFVGHEKMVKKWGSKRKLSDYILEQI